MSTYCSSLTYGAARIFGGFANSRETIGRKPKKSRGILKYKTRSFGKSRKYFLCIGDRGTTCPEGRMTFCRGCPVQTPNAGDLFWGVVSCFQGQLQAVPMEAWFISQEGQHHLHRMRCTRRVRHCQTKQRG